MTAGIKTYNAAINVDHTGAPVPTIAHLAQRRGLGVGIVTSVPISHATPAAAYAHNVSRNDYQDLTRDLLGLPSIGHPRRSLPGLDVVIGAGHGVDNETDAKQGENFVPGNRYLTKPDLQTIDVDHGGRYVVAERTASRTGNEVLREGVDRAIERDARLLGFFGVGGSGYLAGHLPFASANGDFRPAPGVMTKDVPTAADVRENPTLAEMTRAALDVLSRKPKGFWLLVEAGDVDWASHDNNLDAAIGAVHSGDAAFATIVDWVERHSSWRETLVIVTADHGHYLVLDRPERLRP